MTDYQIKTVPIDCIRCSSSYPDEIIDRAAVIYEHWDTTLTPLVVDQDMNLFGDGLTYQVYKRLGYTNVPVVVVMGDKVELYRTAAKVREGYRKGMMFYHKEMKESE